MVVPSNARPRAREIGAGALARRASGDVSSAARPGKGRSTARVWATSIGGYQVIKKWLSYREHALLGRALQAKEARTATEIARCHAALARLEPAPNADYNAVCAKTHPSPRDDRERA